MQTVRFMFDPNSVPFLCFTILPARKCSLGLVLTRTGPKSKKSNHIISIRFKYFKNWACSNSFSLNQIKYLFRLVRTEPIEIVVFPICRKPSHPLLHISFIKIPELTQYIVNQSVYVVNHIVSFNFIQTLLLPKYKKTSSQMEVYIL